MHAQLIFCLTLLAGSAEDAGVEQDVRFAFGVEYMVPGLAEVFAATGARWAKAAPAGFDWGTIEPQPPVGGRRTYDWSWPDGLISEYQRAGFKHLHIYTQVRNRWAGTQALVGNASLPPKPEFLQGYAEYLRAMVERYDGDGREDMPGLLYPVRYWEIEAEWGTFWQGSVEQYLELLRVAHRTIKQADPKAKIILQGFLLMGIFDGDPSPEQLQRLKEDPRWGKRIRQGLADMDRLWPHAELFDAVEFHSLGDWSEIPATARFLRQQMQRHQVNKPIWVGDVNFNLNPMLWYDEPFYPYRREQKEEILKWLRAMRDAGDPLHARAVAWFRAEQASFTAKKILCAAGEGLAGINMGNLEDWTLFGIVPRISGTGGFCGLIDIRGRGPTDRSPKHAWAPRIPGQPRTAYWAIKLLYQKLQTHTAAAPVALREGVHAYRFQIPGQGRQKPSSIVALWYDDRRGQLPGDPEPQCQVLLPTAAATARMCRIPTKNDEATARWQTVPIDRGQIRLNLGKTPILVEELAP